jgi:hypothetical protein
MDDKYKYEVFVEARKMMNYYKGEVLPFVNKMCRKDMTSGDIDGFIWDYYRKVYIVIEQKRSLEKHKDSQHKHLQFLQAMHDELIYTERFAAWKFYVFKIIGDPPFHNCIVHNIATDEKKDVNQEQLKMLFDMDIFFEDL